MKTKIIISSVLLLFVCVSLMYTIVDGSRPGSVTAEPSNETAVSEDKAPDTGESNPQQKRAPEHVVLAYYFHSTQRCPTCLKIEAYTEESLREAFAEKIKAGALEWRTLNMHLPENEHYIDDFKLTTSSVILVDTFHCKQKEWKNLPKVWQLVRDKQAFFSYIQTETADFLKE